jgi:hypothetical protein
MKKVLLILMSVISLSGFAQKVKLATGSLKDLKGEKTMKTEFIYDGMVISRDNIPEADYIARKKKDYNAKEIGRGDTWEKQWYADRTERFEPKFNELLEKHGKISTIGEAKYTLIFKTIMTEPGWNVGVARASARIDAEAWIVETSNPSNIIAKITVTNAPGGGAMGYDFDAGYRLQEAYAKSGKEIGQLIVSATK